MKEERLLVYPSYVTKIVEDYGDTIISPRKVNKDEYLKIHHKYTNHEFGKLFKVEECFTTEKDIYNYTVKFQNNRYATISTPLHNTMYEILIDKDQLLLDRQVINEDIYYLGFRIKRLFYKRINDKKYSCFIPYILYDGNNSLNDNRQYKVVATFDNNLNMYTYFKFIAMNK